MQDNEKQIINSKKTNNKNIFLNKKILIVFIFVILILILFLGLFFGLRDITSSYKGKVYINNLDQIDRNQYFLSRGDFFKQNLVNKEHYDLFAWLMDGKEKNVLEPLENQNTYYSKITNSYSYLYYENNKLTGEFEYIDEDGFTHIAIIDKDGNIIQESNFGYDSSKYSHHHEMGMTSNDIYNTLVASNIESDNYSKSILDNGIFLEDNNDSLENPKVEYISIADVLEYTSDDFYYKDKNGYTRYAIFELEGKWKEDYHEAFHCNSLEYNDKNDEIIVNSRNFGMIFAISTEGIFTDNYIPTLNWVFSGTPYNYYYSNIDENGETPIIYQNGIYVENPNFTPTINKNWEDKTINTYTVGNETYDFNDLNKDNPSSIMNLPASAAFAGEHFVRYLNSYIESIPNYLETFPNYNSDLSYYSMFDNHEPGVSIFSEHYDGSNPYDINEGFENQKSFLKVVAVDENNMSASLIVNEEIPRGDFKGDALFYTIDDDNYVCTFSTEGNYSDTNFNEYGQEVCRTLIIKYDGIDASTMTLKDKEIMYAMSFPEGATAYRGYPFWLNLDNIEIGWNSYFYI